MPTSMKKSYVALTAIVACSLVALGAGCERSETDQRDVMNDQNQMGQQGENLPVAQPQDQGVMVGGAMMVASKNIVENAMMANNVTTLVKAVKAAGLDTTLSGPGPFTVFAPTDSAFGKIPTSTLETLLKPENKADLTAILTYHVVPGALRSSDLQDGRMLTTVNGKTLKVERNGNEVRVGGVMVETADVISSNGVTHVIGTVLMP